MVCLACSKRTKQNDSNDCFENALDTLRQHYMFYKNSIRKRDLELLQLKERNEELMKALELLQNAQQQAKRFKTNMAGSWISPNNSGPNADNYPRDDVITDISSTDDDESTPGASNLNMALNSEQLFETSVTSPGPKLSNSEMIISSRTKASPRRNKQMEDVRALKDRNKQLGRSKTEWHAKERSSPSDKSWATKFVKPAAKVKAPESTAVGEGKLDKKVNLSLKRINPSKMKQSLLNFNSSKESSLIEPAICDDVIDASPVVCKNSRAGRSWAQRNGPNLSAHSNTNLLSDETKRSHEDITSMPIEDIVFDFSPTKKSDNTANLNSPTIKLSSKQLNFEQMGQESSTACTALPSDQITTRLNNSSVVILTPTTQDIIFVDDSCNENSDMDTMDLLGDIMKQDSTEHLAVLKKYESKNIQRQQKLNEVVQKNQKEDNTNFIKAASCIKKEKVTQQLIEEIHTKENKETDSHSTTLKEFKHLNPLLANSADEDEEEEDAMPKPFVIKEEQAAKQLIAKKLTLKERFNIDCEDCEKYVNYFGDRLSDNELAEHINRCTRHKQPHDMRQNTPEDFWNPFILSFAENDPRNEVLIDARSKDKQGQFGKY